MKEKITVLSQDFAVKIIKLTDKLFAEKRFSLADQLLRSSTSIGANVHEAQKPYGRKEFFRKIQIAAGEAEEASFWLLVLERSGICNEPLDELRSDLNVIRKMLAKILMTTKERLNHRQTKK